MSRFRWRRDLHQELAETRAEIEEERQPRQMDPQVVRAIADAVIRLRSTAESLEQALDDMENGDAEASPT